jgi:hypothetical protein
MIMAPFAILYFWPFFVHMEICARIRKEKIGGMGWIVPVWVIDDRDVNMNVWETVTWVITWLISFWPLLLLLFIK